MKNVKLDCDTNDVRDGAAMCPLQILMKKIAFGVQNVCLSADSAGKRTFAAT